MTKKERHIVALDIGSAKTCALDAKTDHVIVITREGGRQSKDGRQSGGGPQILDVMFIGR